MALRFKCSACGQLHRVPDTMGGRSTYCFSCGNAVTVSTSHPVADDAPVDHAAGEIAILRAPATQVNAPVSLGAEGLELVEGANDAPLKLAQDDGSPQLKDGVHAPKVQANPAPAQTAHPSGTKPRIVVPISHTSDKANAARASGTGSKSPAPRDAGTNQRPMSQPPEAPRSRSNSGADPVTLDELVLLASHKKTPPATPALPARRNAAGGHHTPPARPASRPGSTDGVLSLDAIEELAAGQVVTNPPGVPLGVQNNSGPNPALAWMRSLAFWPIVRDYLLCNGWAWAGLVFLLVSCIIWTKRGSFLGSSNKPLAAIDFKPIANTKAVYHTAKVGRWNSGEDRHLLVILPSSAVDGTTTLPCLLVLAPTFTPPTDGRWMTDEGLLFYSEPTKSGFAVVVIESFQTRPQVFKMIDDGTTNFMTDNMQELVTRAREGDYGVGDVTKAFDFLLAHVPAADPTRCFLTSYQGDVDLLFSAAAAESRLAGAIAVGPALTDNDLIAADTVDRIEKLRPGYREYVRRLALRNNTVGSRCNVTLLYLPGDSQDARTWNAIAALQPQRIRAIPASAVGPSGSSWVTLASNSAYVQIFGRQPPSPTVGGRSPDVPAAVPAPAANPLPAVTGRSSQASAPAGNPVPTAAPVTNTPSRELLVQFANLGAQVSTNANQEIVSIDLRRSKDVAAAAKVLAGFTRAPRLRLLPSQFTPDALMALNNITAIQCLDFSDVKIVDADLTRIAELSNVEALYLADQPITLDGVRTISSMRNLTNLNLHGTKIRDDACQYLAQLSALQDLDISNTAVTSNGVMQLKPLKELARLVLTHTDVSVSAQHFLQMNNRKLRIISP